MKSFSTGSYLPPFVLTNEMLSEYVDTDSEWIIQRTGIEERRVSQGESTAKLGEQAARKAIEAAGIDIRDIDLIIFATVTPDGLAPTTASYMQGMLGIENAIAFDLVAGCTGFVYAMSVADSMIRSKLARHALIVGSEVFSKCLDYEDRGSCILFGDGAGAMVMSAETSSKIEDIYLNGSFDKNLSIVIDSAQPIDEFPPKRRQEMPKLLKLDGKEVYKFAVPALEDCVRTLLERNDLTGDDITYIIPHQANKRIVASAAKSLKLSQDKFFMNIHKYGNTSSASIPIALDEMDRAGLLKSGDRIILAGFGAGLTWGSILIKW
ncbi:MAG: beta-ketoacyl-ACP synthase III [Peptostreptococcaceae bacterium]|nr:beta-ketoacyl-ACP synthase III [Peptostreptococcaceae bacterium]